MGFDKLRILLVIYCIVSVASASVQKSIDPIGPHFEVFRFEKNENPQNLMVIYTKLDENCQFVLETENPVKPVVGYYWLMDGERYKPVHFLIRTGISERLRVLIPADFPTQRNYFAVHVRDLIEINPSLSEAYVRVRAILNGKRCEVKTTFDIESENNEKTTLLLEKIYAESVKTILPPFRRVTSLRFEGVNQKTGQPDEKIFKK